MKKKVSNLVKASLIMSAASGLSSGDASASQHSGFSYLGTGKTLRQALIQKSGAETPFLGSKTEENKDVGEMKCGEGMCGDKMRENGTETSTPQGTSSSAAEAVPEADPEIDVDGSAAENPPADD